MCFSEDMNTIEVRHNFEYALRLHLNNAAALLRSRLRPKTGSHTGSRPDCITP